MAQSNLMSLLFGKKRAVRRSRKSTKKSTKKSEAPRRPKGLSASLRKLARKFKVKTRVMRGSKHVGYRKVSHIKRDVRKKQKALKKRTVAAKKAGKKTRRSRRRRSSFGVGGSYMPLSSFMSPISSVSSGPPWI
jgi:pyruvate/2-oxoglutarate dehydrogenase complex dihydrolipoamide acyltransferase (E2) component